MGEDTGPEAAAAKLEAYKSAARRNKEYLIHTRLGGELFSMYPEGRANEIVDTLSLCMAAAYMDPGDMRVAMRISRDRLSYMTSDDGRLMRMFDDDLAGMYDVLEKRNKV